MKANRTTFDIQLDALMDRLLILASMVETAVRQSVMGLIKLDLKTGEHVIANDQAINEERYFIENEIITLIATQQPVARDLRLLVAMLEIQTELERIGDYAKGIGKITLLLAEQHIDVVLCQMLQEMCDLGLEMLRDALDAFLSKDAASAQTIPARDDQVDAIYKRVHRYLLDLVIKDKKNVSTADYLLWAAHNLERLADRVTNICERIVYVNTGKMLELDTVHSLETTSNMENTLPKQRVLFLCTGNSARSQMAEAFLRYYGGQRFEAFSAGLEPKSINPLTFVVMQEVGLDISGHRSKGVEEFLTKLHFHTLITVCDQAEKNCPSIWPGINQRLHWSFEDPAAFDGNEDEKLNKFREVRDLIKTKVQDWILHQ